MGLKKNEDYFEEAKKMLSEASSLIQEDTIDSLLRYFQTGMLDKETHLPSVLRKHDTEIQIKLAKKMEPMLKELGFIWNNEKLSKDGTMVLEYIKGQYHLEFATLIPSNRTLRFHFDFVEMEREREIKMNQIKRKITDTKERYLDSKKYLAENTGIKKFKNIKTVERIEENIKNIGSDIKALEKEIKEINQQKELLFEIQKRLDGIKYHFGRYGVVLEFAKNEEYDI